MTARAFRGASGLLARYRGAALAVAGLFAMRIFFALYPTYLPNGPPVVPELPVAGSAASEWKGLETPGVSRIQVADRAGVRLSAISNRAVSIECPIASVAGVDAFRVRARCRSEGLVRGQHSYQVGRVVLAFVDAVGTSHWDWPHVIGSAEGTRPWRRIERHLAVPPGAVSARMIIHHSGRSGTFEATDLDVVPMRVNPWNPYAFSFWGMLWGAGAWTAVWRLRLRTRRGGPAVLAVAALIVIGMLIPGRWIDNVGGEIRRVLAPRPHPVASRPPPAGARPPVPTAPAKPDIETELRTALAGAVDVHKAGHLVAFAALALAAAGCFSIGLVRRNRQGTIVAVAGLLLYAVAAEQLQWLTLTRSAKLSDVGVNVMGLAAGLLLAEAWRAMRRTISGSPAVGGAEGTADA